MVITNMQTITQQTPEQDALLAKIRADIAKREWLKATRAGCSAWHIMTKGTRR